MKYSTSIHTSNCKRSETVVKDIIDDEEKDEQITVNPLIR
jgi:hypothetical protein